MSFTKFNKNSYPFHNGLSDFFDRDSLFNDDFFNLEKSLPAMNVKGHDNDFEIEFASPGFNKKAFESTMKDDVLEISAQKSEEKEEKEDAYTRKEFNYRSFRRALQLPKTVDDTKNVKATYPKIATLKKRKSQRKAKRKIEVV